MNKLRNKIFTTIFLLLTTFLVTILVIFNYQDYSKEKENIRNNLNRLNNRINNNIPKPPNNIDKKEEPNNFSNRVFMDLSVYTITLDNNNNIIEVFNHSEDNKDNKNITKRAKEIIHNNQKDDIQYIGNLYINKYSYSLKNNNYLTIIDNTNINKRLKSSLVNSMFIFIVLELIIIITTNKITASIIKPAINSFNKQKEFIADASHELKTPLAVILASAEALEDNPKEIKWLNNIKNETQRMSNLITDLLSLASIENTTDYNNYKNTNLSRAIEKQVLIFDSLAFEEKLKIEYTIEPNINFKCNSNQMKQLISILLDNAIKHSYKNEKILVKLFKEKNEIILTVTNKGKEIPKEEYEKIFERFYRLDKSRNRKDNRYGLGLAIAKNIVINHNGKISVNSSNNYTTFKVILKSTSS